MRHFERRLHAVLNESGSGPKIVVVDFYNRPAGMIGAVATYDDGLQEWLFSFNPDVCSFSRQQLIGLTKQEALWLKDRETDEGLGIEEPA